MYQAVTITQSVTRLLKSQWFQFAVQESQVMMD